MRSVHEHNHNAIPARAFTHGGIFHADDVFAAALLLMLNPGIEIERGFSVPDGFEGVVFDIGGGEFDHHFEGRRVRDNGVPYAAFGLVWDSFGERLLSHPDDRRAFDERFVQPIDLSDNTGAPCEFSETVASFNPSWDSDDAPDDRFAAAVQWAKQALEGRIGALASQRNALEIVRERMEACDGRVLTLDRYLPWQPAVVGSGYSYVVFPSLRGGFNVQVVPTGLHGEELVKPFPEEWRGKDAGELRLITGISDISFCHLTGFLCAAESLEGALAAARLSLGEC